MTTSIRSAGEEIFMALMERGEQALQLPLAWAALTAALKNPQQPAAVQDWLADLEHLKKGAQAALRRESDDVAEKVHALNEFFKGAGGFRGNIEDYNDPANTYLDDVLARRKGIPISLSLIFIELGNSADLQIDPIGFPAHFLVMERSQEILCDPFNGQVDLEPRECLEMVSRIYGQPIAWKDDFLQVPSKATILLRMLNNLRNCYAMTSDHVRLEAAERLIDHLSRLETPESEILLH